MSSKTSQKRRIVKPLIGIALVIGLGVAAFATQNQWMPYLTSADSASQSPPALNSDDAHEGHDHGQAGHNESASIELSDRGLKNIGFEPYRIVPTEYQKTLTLPAIVVERPGRSQIHITAPLTGAISKIHAVTGEAIAPGDLMFELRLTHEELVTSQRDYLATSAKLEIVNREIQRLEGLGEGVIAGKRVLEQKYEKQKLEVELLAQEQAMLLHGLSDEQVASIRTTQRLFRSIEVRAPAHTDAQEARTGPHLFTVQSLGVSQGEQVDVGRELAILADHCELHVEGLAFEDDASQIRDAAREKKSVAARLMKGESPGAAVQNLRIQYVADQIDPSSRALKVYLSLPNEVALDRQEEDGRRVLEWRYKPGQRLQINIPVETWKNQLVLPPTAVVEEGAEAYAYRQNGDHFDQVPVHVLYRDQDSLVIANDGALFPDDIIAGDGAYQMHLALKNKAGGGVDPHAGHNH